ncbi:MAG: CHRD domain-containing protein [Nitrososphaeraceae archaeon]
MLSRKISYFSLLLILSSGVVLIFITLTSSEIFAKKIATLSGDQVVPPVSTNATGHATFKHPNSATMNYKVNITGIYHPSGIGIHMGKMGSNGDLIVNLMKQSKEQQTKLGMVITGSFTGSDLIGPKLGKNILDLVTSMKSGDTYISVNTEKHPTGEIRGQIELANPASSNETNSIQNGNSTYNSEISQ